MVIKISSLFLSVALISAAVLTVTTGRAHAYIDLGSVSFLLQMFVASLFASLFALKVFWSRWTSKVTRLFSKIKSLKSG